MEKSKKTRKTIFNFFEGVASKQTQFLLKHYGFEKVTRFNVYDNLLVAPNNNDRHVCPCSSPRTFKNKIAFLFVLIDTAQFLSVLSSLLIHV